MNTLSLFLDSAVAETLGWTVLHSLWQGALLVLIVKIVFQVGTQWPARRRYYLAYTALVGQLLLAVGTFYYLLPSSSLPPEAGLTELLPIIPGAETLIEPSSWWVNLEAMIAPSLPLIVVVWWLGMIFFLLRLALSYYWWNSLRQKDHLSPPQDWQERFRGLKHKMGITRKVQLKVSALVPAPLLIGQLKPLVLLPVALLNQLSVGEVEAILAHELAHLRRYDYVLNVIQLFLEAVFYYHPAIWWLGSTIRVLREQCCDDLAIHYTGNSLTYAKTLLRVAETQHQFPGQVALGLLGGNKRHLLQRIQRILNQPVKQPDMREKFAVTSVLLSLALLVSLTAGWSWPVDEAFVTEDHPTLITIDTLPQGKVRMEIDEDGETLDVTINKGKIRALKINGKVIPEAEFPKYESMVEEKLANLPPPPPPPGAPAPPPPPPAPGAPPAPPAPPAIGAPPAPPAPGAPQVIIKNKEIRAIRTMEDGKEVIIIQTDEGDEGANIWIQDDEDVDANIWIQDGDGEEHIIVTRPTAPLGMIEIITKDGEEHIFIKGNGYDERIEIDPEDIERMNVFKFDKGNEERIKELKARFSEMDAVISEKALRAIEEWEESAEELRIVIDEERLVERELEIERSAEQRRAEAEQRRAMMEERRTEMDREVRIRGLRHDSREGDWLSRQLLRDDLVEDGENFTFKLSAKRLKVNGKSQSAEIHRRYLELYEARTGVPVDDGTNVNISRKSN